MADQTSIDAAYQAAKATFTGQTIDKVTVKAAGMFFQVEDNKLTYRHFTVDTDSPRQVEAFISALEAGKVRQAWRVILHKWYGTSDLEYQPGEEPEVTLILE